jgi:hypothetical protein
MPIQLGKYVSFVHGKRPFLLLSSSCEIGSDFLVVVFGIGGGGGTVTTTQPLSGSGTGFTNFTKISAKLAKHYIRHNS